MNTFKTLITLSFASVIIISACTSPVDKLNNEIKIMEKALYSDSSLSPGIENSRKMIDMYITFAEKFPSDTSTPVYLFRAADLSAKIHEITNSIHLFEKLRREYPNHRNAPFALFLQGFIYENQTGDPMKAKPYYEEFLSLYPDHPIAGDVAFSLENLGKTPEELIKVFELNAEASEELNPDKIVP